MLMTYQLGQMGDSTMPRFSANLGFLWTELPLLQRIDAAAVAGFQAVELHAPYDTDPLAVRERCQTLGIKLLNINTLAGDIKRGECGLAALPGRERDFQRLFDEALSWAQIAGARGIHAVAGIPNPDYISHARATLIDNIRVAADKAEQHDMQVLLEPMNALDRPGYIYQSADQVAQLLLAIDRPNARMLLDLYHEARGGFDPMLALDRHLSSVGHIQIASIPDRHEPDGGELDYTLVFERLDKLGYKGWVGCEYRPRTTIDEGLGWMTALGALST